MAMKEKKIKRSVYEKAKQRVRDARDAQHVVKAWDDVVKNTVGVIEEQVVAVVLCDDGRTRVEIEVRSTKS